MASKEVIIEIKGDVSDIVKKTEQASGAMDKLGSTVKNMFSLQLLQQAGSMLSGIFNKMSDFVSLYENQRTQENKLLALMKNRNDFSQKMYTQHLAFARKLQESTNYGDEQILNVISQFQTFGNISQDMVQKVTQATLNIAQTTGQDAISVAIQVAKAMSEPVKMASALRRSGIMFDENKLKSLGTLAQQQAYLMQEINSQYSGAAAGGQSELQKFKNILGDIKEEIGRGLMPLFAGFASVILKVAQAVSSVVGWFNDMFNSTTNISDAVKELNVAFAKHNQDMADISSTENMINKYEELSNKANKTAAEQKQLSDITQQLAQKMPSAITAFDKYGKAIGIVAKEARSLMKEQKQLAQEALEAQTENALNQAQKALNNLLKARSYQNQTTTQKGISNIFGSITSSIPGLNLFTDTSQFNSSERNKTYKEIQKLIPQYDTLYDATLRMQNIEEKHIKTMYDLAKAAGKTRLSYAAYKSEMQAAQSVHSSLIRQYGELYTGLNSASQEQARLSEEFFTSREEYKKHLKSLKRQEEARRNQASKAKAAAKEWLKAVEALKEYMSKLNEVNMTEYEIKVKANFDEFEKNIKKFFGENIAKQYRLMIQDAILKGGTESEAALTQIIQNIANASRQPIENISSMVDNIREKIKKQNQESVDEINNLVRQFTQDSESLSIQLDEIEKKRLELIKKIKNSGLSQSQQERDINAVNAGAEQKGALAIMKSIKDTIEGVKEAFEGIKNGVDQIKKGGVSGVAKGVGSIGESIGNALGKFGVKQMPVIGGIIGAVGGLVGGIASLFESEGETFQEKWQRLFDLAQSKYSYELAKERELQAQIQKRMELYSYLEKIYGEDTKEAYESQKKLLQENIDSIIEKFSEKGSVTLDGETYDVSNISSLNNSQLEELLSAMTQNESKYSDAAKAKVQYYAQLVKNYAQEVHNADNAGVKRLSPLLVDAYQNWVQSAKDTGYTGGFYSIADLLDKYGNDGGQGVSDINRNMAQWLNYFEYASASADALSGDLETYIDQTQELVNLEKKRVDAANELLNIQSKLSDELTNQLKALNNATINNLLNQLDELEYKINTGQISEGSTSAINARQNIMTAISNVLGQTGQTTLQSAVISQRASYLSEADQEKFLKMAGIGNVVTFADGGYTGNGNNLRLVGAGETVLNPTVTRLLSSQLGVTPQRLQDALTASSLSGGGNFNVHVASTFNGIPSNADFASLENKIVDTVERVYKRIGKRM